MSRKVILSSFIFTLIIVVSVLAINSLFRVKVALFSIDSIEFDRNSQQCKINYSGKVPNNYTVIDIFEEDGVVTSEGCSSGSSGPFSLTTMCKSTIDLSVCKSDENLCTVLVKEGQDIKLKNGETFLLFNGKSKIGTPTKISIKLVKNQGSFVF